MGRSNYVMQTAFFPTQEGHQEEDALHESNATQHFPSLAIFGKKSQN